MQPKQTNEDPFLDPAMLLGIIDRLTREREQARSIATLLEAECANCWGPVHSETLRLMGQGAHDGA
jgi:hypothetical protein